MKKPKLSRDQIIHLAKLAKLNLSEKEIENYQHQLPDVLDYIDKLNKLNTFNIQELDQVIGLENKFRTDQVDNTRKHSPKQALANAKNTHNHHFQVDSVL